MKVLILGSGVIGVSNAYYLAKLGHEVTVIDRQPEAGLETSFANAGEVSPGYSAPWAGPGVPTKALKWLAMEHGPLRIGLRFDPAMWRWAASMLRNCTEARYELNKGRMVRLAEYSRDCIRDLREDTGINYDQRTQGTLQMFRSQKQLDAIGADTAILDRYGVPYEVLDRQGCIAVEPGLRHVKDKVAGGLRLVNDETGDCFKFTQSLAERAKELGVVFRHNVTIHGLRAEGGKLAEVITSAGRLTADAYVMALGSYSPRLLAPIGVKIPVYPVKGYSITLPVTDASSAPVSTMMDETHKVAITRLGDRIRVAGTAELNGYNLDLTPARRKTIEHVVSDLFPKGGDVSKSEFWAGLRPMTPDGTPCLGGTKFENLYLNTGHGTLGWTMACGSGRLMADIISGRTPEIDMDGLTVARYVA